MKSEIKISGNRLQITRIFDAPRESVFPWWSQAEMLHAATMVRLQGRHTMRGRDGLSRRRIVQANNADRRHGQALHH